MSLSKQYFVDLILASDLSLRLRSALELGVAIALLMILTVLAVSRFETYVVQSQIAEAFGLSSTIRSEMVVHRAQHGDWPKLAAELSNATLTQEDSLGRYVDHFRLGPDGSLTTVFNDGASSARLRNRRLTFRPLTVPAEPSAPVAWVCGSHRYPTELVPGGTDETDIAPSDLPSACRKY